MSQLLADRPPPRGDRERRARQPWRRGQQQRREGEEGNELVEVEDASVTLPAELLDTPHDIITQFEYALRDAADPQAEAVPIRVRRAAWKRRAALACAACAAHPRPEALRRARMRACACAQLGCPGRQRLALGCWQRDGQQGRARGREAPLLRPAPSLSSLPPPLLTRRRLQPGPRTPPARRTL